MVDEKTKTAIQFYFLILFFFMSPYMRFYREYYAEYNKNKSTGKIIFVISEIPNKIFLRNV